MRAVRVRQLRTQNHVLFHTANISKYIELTSIQRTGSTRKIRKPEETNGTRGVWFAAGSEGQDTRDPIDTKRVITDWVRKPIRNPVGPDRSFEREVSQYPRP
ncbi:hypothetical protein ACOSP7_003248 [Xanthoceras sorbifolium]